MDAPDARPDTLNPCPEESYARDEQAGPTLLRTCGRIPAPPDGLSDLHLVTFAVTDGRLDAIDVDRTPPEPRDVIDLAGETFTTSQGCWPWLAYPRPIPMARHTRGFELGWADDGTLATVEVMQDGVRSGSYYVVRADGTPALIGRYEDDLMHGVWVWIDASGQLTMAKLYIYGVFVADLPVQNVDRSARPVTP
ncbi:MAG: hypothetical protein U1F43_36570 [Myxococcota bacterium]